MTACSRSGQITVAVIGAGVIGSAIAAGLARSGARVSLIERARPGAGASSTTLAWVNANNKRPAEYYDLNLAGMREHHALAGRDNRSFHPVGHLEVAGTPEHAQRIHEKLKRLRSLDYPVDELSAEQATRRLPELAPTAAVRGGAWYPSEGYCEVPRFIAHELQSLGAAGGNLQIKEAQSVASSGSGIRVWMRDGTHQTFDRIAIAAGRDTQAILAASGFDLPMYRAQAPGDADVGFLAMTHPLPLSLDTVLTTSDLTVRPDGHGRFTLQALDLDIDAHPHAPTGVTDRVGREMAGRLARLLSLPYQPPIAQVRVGVRPLPLDGLTISGFVDQREQIYVTVTHSGVTLAPILGKLAAEELSGRRSRMLDPFRCQRFNDGSHPILAPARRAGEQ